MSANILINFSLIGVAWALLILFVHFKVRQSQGTLKVLALIASCLGMLALPWLLPEDYTGTKFILACFCMMTGLRFLEVGFRKYPDEKVQASFPTYLKYLLAAPDIYAPVSDGERATYRKLGIQRMGRGALKFIPLLGLYWLFQHFPFISESTALFYTWVVVAAYFFSTGALDLGSGFGMVRDGYRTMEVFNNPLLSSSPRDFWSRRWNLTFKNTMHRLVFTPVNTKGNTLFAVFLVFASSALLHEYIVIAALGYTSGHMTIFFTMHCAAAISYGVISQGRDKPLLPKPLAILAHHIWFLFTSYWFFTPVLQALPIHTWQPF